MGKGSKVDGHTPDTASFPLQQGFAAKALLTMTAAVLYGARQYEISRLRVHLILMLLFYTYCVAFTLYEQRNQRVSQHGGATVHERHSHHIRTEIMHVHLKAYGCDSTEMHSVMLPEQTSQKPTFKLFCILGCQSLPVTLHCHVSLLHITPCPCGLGHRWHWTIRMPI